MNRAQEEARKENRGIPELFKQFFIILLLVHCHENTAELGVLMCDLKRDLLQTGDLKLSEHGRHIHEIGMTDS